MLLPISLISYKLIYGLIAEDKKVECYDKAVIVDIKDKCQQLANEGEWLGYEKRKQTGSFMIEHKHKFMMCQIRKAGSQYWESLFRLLDGPGPVDKSYKHQGDKEFLTRLHADYRKVMFTRDPWDRLWSAYNDKFVNLHPVFLYKYDGILRTILRKKTPSFNGTCVEQVLFSDFLDVVIYEDSSNQNMESHWRPYWDTCAPCDHHYDFVGKLEDIPISFTNHGIYPQITRTRLLTEENERGQHIQYVATLPL